MFAFVVADIGDHDALLCVEKFVVFKICAHKSICALGDGGAQEKAAGSATECDGLDSGTYRGGMPHDGGLQAIFK